MSPLKTMLDSSRNRVGALAVGLADAVYWLRLMRRFWVDADNTFGRAVAADAAPV